ncbi:MAG TPA: hypothetical protein VIH24_02075 [Candidatus Limnocylindria bacterium]|jgi:hypothetical protein
MGTPLGPDEGGGPPTALPWTLVVPEESWEADLEHGAALPRAGEHIEFIADDGTHSLFVVNDVVHVVQHASSERPPVSDETTGPNAIVSESSAEGLPTILRAGLPRVIARRLEES